MLLVQFVASEHVICEKHLLVCVCVFSVENGVEFLTMRG